MTKVCDWKVKSCPLVSLSSLRDLNWLVGFPAVTPSDTMSIQSGLFDVLKWVDQIISCLKRSSMVIHFEWVKMLLTTKPRDGLENGIGQWWAMSGQPGQVLQTMAFVNWPNDPMPDMVIQLRPSILSGFRCFDQRDGLKIQRRNRAGHRGNLCSRESTKWFSAWNSYPFWVSLDVVDHRTSMDGVE